MITDQGFEPNLNTRDVGYGVERAGSHLTGGDTEIS
ncbi:hypothetical protein FHS85_004468 [Rhodoligotrophos appendicifer]